jgi:hypothetical protein
MDLYTLLDLIQSNCLAIVLISTLAYLIVIMKRDGFLVIIIMSCILSALHQFYDAALLSYAQKEENRELVRDLWYLGFASSNFMFVFIFYKVIDKLLIPHSAITCFFINCHVSLGFIQLIRYADRVLLKTDLLGNAYQLAIPAINLSMVIITMIYVSYSITYNLKGRLN